eukprot:4994068-Pleurochrysis_carterae.AAC.7
MPSPRTTGFCGQSTCDRLKALSYFARLCRTVWRWLRIADAFAARVPVTSRARCVCMRVKKRPSCAIEEPLPTASLPPLECPFSVYRRSGWRASSCR